MKSERITITVPGKIMAAWRQAAETSGVSLSNWITYRTNRPEAAHLLTRVLTELEAVRTPAVTVGLDALDDEERWMISLIRDEMDRLGRTCTEEEAVRIAVRRSYHTVKKSPAAVRAVLGPGPGAEPAEPGQAAG